MLFSTPQTSGLSDGHLDGRKSNLKAPSSDLETSRSNNLLVNESQSPSNFAPLPSSYPSNQHHHYPRVHSNSQSSTLTQGSLVDERTSYPSGQRPLDLQVGEIPEASSYHPSTDDKAYPSMSTYDCGGNYMPFLDVSYTYRPLQMNTMPPTLFPQSYTDIRTIDGPSMATTTFPVDPSEHSGYLIAESQCSDPSLGYPQTRRTHQVDGYLHQPIPRASHPGYSSLTMNVPQVSETFDRADHLSNSYLTSTSHPMISQREIEDARSRPRRLSPLPYARRAHAMGVPMHQDPLEYKLPRLSSVKKNSDKKQILACLFCRERKIACGRPPEGSEDPTCNQCARRAQRCEYPTESRRGLHRRATYRHLRTHSANGFT